MNPEAPIFYIPQTKWYYNKRTYSAPVILTTSTKCNEYTTKMYKKYTRMEKPRPSIQFNPPKKYLMRNKKLINQWKKGKQINKIMLSRNKFKET